MCRPAFVRAGPCCLACPPGCPAILALACAAGVALWLRNERFGPLVAWVAQVAPIAQVAYVVRAVLERIAPRRPSGSSPVGCSAGGMKLGSMCSTLATNSGSPPDSDPARRHAPTEIHQAHLWDPAAIGGPTIWPTNQKTF